MQTDKKTKEEILLRAEKMLYYNELLIKQCDRWLSAEEGNQNMERDILEKHKKKKTKPETSSTNIASLRDNPNPKPH